MSRFERGLLAILWPAAVGFLALAISEIIRTVLEGGEGGANSAGLPRRQLAGVALSNNTHEEAASAAMELGKPWTAYIPQVSMRECTAGVAYPLRSSR